MVASDPSPGPAAPTPSTDPTALASPSSSSGDDGPFQDLEAAAARAPRRVPTAQEDPVPFYLARTAPGWRQKVLRFTPGWFSVTMGTGIVGNLIFLLPWRSTHPAFRIVSACFLVFTAVLFACISGITAARLVLYPRIARAVLANETHSLFLGTIPMGLVTIVSGPALHSSSWPLPGGVMAASVLWWLNAPVNAAVVVGVPYAVMTMHNHRTEGMTAAWLLPIVPPITQAATGSTLVAYLAGEHPGYAMVVLITSYVSLGVGLLLAYIILALYLNRLAFHHLPAREAIVSVFLPLGPCGQGGFALIQLGKGAASLLPVLAPAHPAAPGLASLGPIMHGTGVVWGLLLWGLGMWWFAMAVSSAGPRMLRGETGFNMGWWAFTFPLGSMTLLTLALGDTFASIFFHVLATIFTAMLLIAWVVVFFPSMKGFFHGTLFQAPCLATLPEEYLRRHERRPSPQKDDEKDADLA